MNNKGFTLIETIISLSLGAMLILTALYAPITLVRQFKYFTNYASVQADSRLVITSIHYDLIKSGNTFRLDGNTLTIGDEEYFFTEDTVSRNLIALSRTAMEIQPIVGGFRIGVLDTSGTPYYFLREELD